MANHRQLVLLACIESHQSPAIRVKPDFSKISVTGLGSGDVLLLCNADLQIELPDGDSPFPKDLLGRVVTFRKLAGSQPNPTTVEIIREGMYG